MLTLLAAVLLARIVTAVLEEDVYPRTRLPRGVPYVLSTLVRYGRYSLGFLLALPALGVELAQLTIVLGGSWRLRYTAACAMPGSPSRLRNAISTSQPICSGDRNCRRYLSPWTGVNSTEGSRISTCSGAPLLGKRTPFEIESVAPRRTMLDRWAVTSLIGAVLVYGAAVAAQEQGSNSRTAELSREFTDPLTTLPQLFVQDAYTPANYGTEAPANRVIMRLIVPRVPRISLLPDQLIRPSLQLVTVPTGKGNDTRTEFGDMQLFDFGVIPWPSRETGLLMGVGPVFVFPTATHRLAGQGAWQVGPGFAAIYKGIPGIIFGMLIQNPISFAYTSDDRKPVSTLLVQPIVLTYVGRGFYVKSGDATWALNWHQHTPTTIPLSFGIGHVMVREGLPPINLFVTGEWMAYRQFAPVAPQTTVRFGMTMAFPQWRPWR